MERKVLCGAILCIVFFWCCRIYSINQIEITSSQFSMGDKIRGENIDIIPLEACLYDREGFISSFKLEEDVLEEYVPGGDEDKDCKIICVCLLVSNESERDISWDVVMDATSCGFETRTWASTNMPFIGRWLNLFNDECLRAGQKQKIWYVTIVNPICFKEKTWDALKCNDFKYVLAIEPQKICIQLE